MVVVNPYVCSTSTAQIQIDQPVAQFWCNVSLFRMNTYKSVSKQRTLTPFGINTCEKRPGGGSARRSGPGASLACRLPYLHDQECATLEDCSTLRSIHSACGSGTYARSAPLVFFFKQKTAYEI